MAKEKRTGKDPRFATTSALLKVGGAKDFHYIFRFIPKTVVAKEMGMNPPAFTKCTHNPKKFTLEEIERLAALFDYPFEKFLKIIVREIKNPGTKTGMAPKGENKSHNKDSDIFRKEQKN
jgi:hypothetical protein